jgi:hypothetical protein
MPSWPALSAGTPTASALRRAALSMHADGCLHTRTVCPLCKKEADPWHALACSAVRRRAVTTRHDRSMQLLVHFARSNDVLARFEPINMGSRVPDGELIFPRKIVTVDLTGVHFLAPHLHSSR